jgi:hypothetical protein
MGRLLGFTEKIPQSIEIEELMRIPIEQRRVEAAARRILCVGKDIEHMSNQCAVLALNGYTAKFCAPGQVKQCLRAGKYALVILSTTSESDEIEQVTDAVSSCTRILALESVILPKELLCVVRLMLG